MKGVSLVVAATLVACASGPVDRTPLNEAAVAIQHATDLGAAFDSRSRVALANARQEYAAADAFAAQGNGARARSMSMRAQADARLAQALAHEAAVTAEGRTPVMARGGGER